MKSHYTRYQAATAIAIFFHAIGILGMLFVNRAFFINATPYHLLFMGALLIYTQEKITKGFIYFIAACCTLGIAVEILGTSTGMLFGDYVYGQTLGYSFKNVPLIIGVNWFIAIYCCGVAVSMLFAHLSRITSVEAKVQSNLLKFFSVVIDGATLAVFFDWFLEPAAIKLGYWQWNGDGEVPLFNYFCWFIVSAVFLTIFQTSSFPKQNKFALNLLLIQLMFFLLVRTFL